MRKLFTIVAIVISLVAINLVSFAGERLSLGYMYGGSKSHSEIVAATNNSVNVVSPTCFDLTPSGRLTMNTIFNGGFVQEMHSKGIKVTPFLSNHWGQKRAQAALKNKESLINELIDAVEEYEFDGINVDFENLTVADKDNLTDFMRALREALPAEKTLSIAVAANPEKLTKTWVAAYDYKNLAKYVDYLVIMTYDEHCYGGAAGPVASINFVEKSIQNVLEEVSKDKIVMGIPLYGRFWKEGAESGGEAIVIGRVERLIQQERLVPTFDNVTKTPMLKLVVKESDDITDAPYINGRYLEPGTYYIWYENEHSIKAKLELVNKYDILGTGLWALDNESPEFWNTFKEDLNAKPYETEKEIKIKKKIEFAKQYVVSQKVEIAKPKLVLEKYDEIMSFISLKELDESKAELTYGIIKNEQEIRDIYVFNDNKIRNIRLKRYIVKLNKRIKSLKKDIFGRILDNICDCKRICVVKSSELLTNEF